MAANALVAMANTGTMQSEKSSTLATNASSGNKTKIVVLKIPSLKKAKEKQSEDPGKTRKDNSRESRGLATETTLVGPSIAHISALASEADLKRQYIALRLRNGDFNISDPAHKLLERTVKAFILDLLAKNKRGEPDNPIKAQQQILAAKREAARKERQKRDDERLAALFKRMTDAIECQKQPGESEEDRLMRETVKRVHVATQKDKFRKTADRKQAFRNLEAIAARYEDLYDPSFDFGLGIRLSVFGPLE